MTDYLPLVGGLIRVRVRNQGKRMRRIVGLIVGVSLCQAANAQQPFNPEAFRAELQRKMNLIQPLSQELNWQRLPWVTSPDEALQQARDENRPILLWVAGGRQRDGTPLERCCAYAANLRTGPLNDEQVVQRISATMVPLAINNDRIPPTPGGRLIRSVLHDTNASQGLWILHPRGSVLGYHYFRPRPGESNSASDARWVRETREFVETGLKEFGPVAERSVVPKPVVPQRGQGWLPDGSMRLALYARQMVNGKHDGKPTVASLDLPPNAWRDFVPGVATVGHRWDIPVPTAQRLAPALSPHTDAMTVPRERDVHTANLRATVEQIRAGKIYVRVQGELASEHDRDGGQNHPIRTRGRVDGLVVVDQARGEPESLLLIVAGSYRNPPPYDTPRGSAAALTWHR
jgi:hypothetical protein